MRGQRFALRMNPARADSKEIASQLAAVAGAGLHEFLRCRAASGGGFGPAPGCDRLPGGGQGAGACQPLAPYNPLPRLRQPSLTGNFSPQAVPFSPLPVARHRASPCSAYDIRQDGRKHSEPKSVTLDERRHSGLFSDETQ